MLVNRKSKKKKFKKDKKTSDLKKKVKRIKTDNGYYERSNNKKTNKNFEFNDIYASYF